MLNGILKGFYMAVLGAMTMGFVSSCGGGGSASNPGTSTNLSPPASLTADAGVQKVILNWSPVADAISYNVYYATSPGVTKETGTKVADQHGPYIARDLDNDNTYYFAVSSVNDSGESALSGEASATPSAAPPPPAPTNVTAAAEAGQVRVSWTASTGTTAQIYYSTAPGVTTASPFKISGAVSPQVVGPLANGVAYYFVVTASNANGESATSFETSATPLASPPPPPPSGLAAVEGDGQATLSWTAVPGATSYNLYYATDFPVTKDTGTKIANVTSPYTVTGLTNKIGYFFVVTSVNAGGESADSATVSATPLASKPLPTLVPIPDGTFQMGDNLDGTAYAMPVHAVQVDEFYIDRYETTYELWKEVYDWAVDPARGDKQYNFDSPGRNGSLAIGTNMPVTMVSWYDVVKWLNARSEKETAEGGNRTPVYYTDASQTVVYRTGRVDVNNSNVKWDANGYRLPTEAEWEKATRGGWEGEGRRYPWGNDLGTGNANYNMGRTVSVGIYPANGYDLYDTAGNVWEWTWDWSSDNYAWAPDGIANPRGPDAPAGTRVRRGGGWSYGPDYLRCFERVFRVPTYMAPYFGFRSVVKVP